MRASNVRHSSGPGVETVGTYSIGRLMVLVAVLAVNIGAMKALIPDRLDTLVGSALIWIVLQVALVRLIQGRDRAFWGGVLAFGTLSLASYVWAMLTPASIGIAPNGSRVVVGGSPAFWVWDVYMRTADRLIAPLTGRAGLGLGIVIVLFTAWMFLPHAAIAVSGGLLCRWFFEGRARGEGLGAPPASGSGISPSGAVSPPPARST
jgi:hypothetical protein